MHIEQIRQLNEMNQRFYARVVVQFSQTRKNAWVGWNRLLKHLPKHNFSILDVGCGNGRFYEFLNQAGLQFSYAGIDLNQTLLDEAQLKDPVGVFERRDIVEELLTDFELEPYDVITAFAVLHHIPSQELRRKFMTSLVRAVNPGGILIISTWQVDHLPKLLKHQQKIAGLEMGDYILTWDKDPGALRYCHLTTDAEMTELTADLNLELLEKCAADGADNQTNHYFIWRKTSAGNL